MDNIGAARQTLYSELHLDSICRVWRGVRRFSPERLYLLLTDREDCDIIEEEERLEWKWSAATDREREERREEGYERREDVFN